MLDVDPHRQRNFPAVVGPIRGLKPLPHKRPALSPNLQNVPRRTGILPIRKSLGLDPSVLTLIPTNFTSGGHAADSRQIIPSIVERECRKISAIFPPPRSAYVFQNAAHRSAPHPGGGGTAYPAENTRDRISQKDDPSPESKNIWAAQQAVCSFDFRNARPT